jgi:hypothetical protein
MKFDADVTREADRNYDVLNQVQYCYATTRNVMVIDEMFGSPTSDTEFNSFTSRDLQSLRC